MTDVSGTLNSLIWLLIILVIIGAVAMIVRAVFAPRADEPYREPPVVQQPVVQQQPAASSGLAPGWYPDQNEASMMRYYDGRTWTSQTQPK